MSASGFRRMLGRGRSTGKLETNIRDYTASRADLELFFDDQSLPKIRPRVGALQVYCAEDNA